jgi:hypothetical protein
MHLSKSKLIAFRQCPKRLWLEIHKPEERDDSGSEGVFAIGNEVGEMAQKVFDLEGTGVNIDPNLIGWKESYAKTKELIQKGDRPVFEAFFRTDRALALADVMRPDRSSGELRWEMLEVKSSTSVKDYHRDDVAIQTHIARESNVSLSRVGLVYINNAFVYQGDGNYSGLFNVEDLTEEAVSRDEDVRSWLDDAHCVANAPKEISCEMGAHCSHPFDCGFKAYCNRLHGIAEDQISVLPRIRATQKEAWRLRGIETLEQVPDSELNSTQIKVKTTTLEEGEFFDATAASRRVDNGEADIYFLDFETVNLAVPKWKGTRPYQQVPFQYSLHLRLPNGEVTHREFLDISGEDPRKALAEQLVTDCGTSGVIYAYNMGFEKAVIRRLAEIVPHLSEQLNLIHDRIDDLLPICRDCYYHPSQKGSWSIKAVLPAMVPSLRYDELEDVQSGGDAIEAYREAIDPNTTSERKTQLEERLLAYCKLDTWATLKIWGRFHSG